MITFIKQGIERIKATKKYSQEKNVPNWYLNLTGAILMCFITSTIITLYSIFYLVPVIPYPFILDLFGKTVILEPFIITALFMLRFGYIPIKAMILFSSLIQKLFMKALNKLDMYLWKKTGKDSMASNFIVKHKRIVQIMFYIPLVLSLILNHIPKH